MAYFLLHFFFFFGSPVIVVGILSLFFYLLFVMLGSTLVSEAYFPLLSQLNLSLFYLIQFYSLFFFFFFSWWWWLVQNFPPYKVIQAYIYVHSLCVWHWNIMAGIGYKYWVKTCFTFKFVIIKFLTILWSILKWALDFLAIHKRGLSLTPRLSKVKSYSHTIHKAKLFCASYM